MDIATTIACIYTTTMPTAASTIGLYERVPILFSQSYRNFVLGVILQQLSTLLSGLGLLVIVLGIVFIHIISQTIMFFASISQH